MLYPHKNSSHKSVTSPTLLCKRQAYYTSIGSEAKWFINISNTFICSINMHWKNWFDYKNMT